MNCHDVKSGLRVKVVKLDTTEGMRVALKHRIVRATGITGIVDGVVGGHGGDVWWVKHDDSDDVGAYCFTELEAIDAKAWSPGTAVAE